MACKAAWGASRRFSVLSQVSLAEGLITFFTTPTSPGYLHGSGLQDLRQSLAGGELKSGYMLGLLSIYCRGPMHIHEGIETLSSLGIEKTTNPRRVIWDYRRKCSQMLSNFWGIIPYWEPPTDPNCARCNSLQVHDITRSEGGEIPLTTNNWWLLKSLMDWQAEPDNWQHVVDLADPLYGIWCSTCFWVQEAKLFFVYISTRSALQLKKLDF
ncbi:hypothetical protein CCACVL1_02311 [Corchorus capsularis]|uniref:Uncharacterized protein n=1 Tax=Corchorus capsularis TaxID=210143 RepID=A0A1R3K9E6_COCAP|nr:hypothetical protein CCACVL1_02311 [Corchorus capsularis]